MTRDRVLPAATAAALLTVYLPVLGHAVTVWSSDRELSFGFLVPPVVLALLWLRRVEIRATLSKGSAWGSVVLVGGLLLLLAGTRSGVHALAAASLLPTSLGVVSYLYGIAAARAVVFPVTLLTFGLCLFRGLLHGVGFALQGLTAQLAASLATILGIPVRQTGYDLFVDDHHFVVAQSCSGMDSLLALLFLGALFVALAPAPPWRRALLLLLVPPIVLAANVARVTVILALAPTLGTALAGGAPHQLLDAFLFVAAATLCYLTALGLRCPPRLAATSSPSS